MRVRGLVAACLLSLGGCALMDTGEIEYRRAERAPVDTQAAMNRARQWPEGTQCRARRAQPEPPDDSARTREPQDPSSLYSRWACYPLFPARLVRRNAGIGDPIRTGEYYSIRIEHAVIANLIEDAFSFRRLMNERDPFRRVGEVAILAHTFEFSATAPAEGADTSSTRFQNLSALDGVKVVYFNPDVEEGQALNFSNIPLREASKYEGRPVGIQIIVIELDRMSAPMRSLMRTLATLGQESAAVPSGPAAAALLELGSSLISQNNDDVMFEYRFVLDPFQPSAPLQTSPFEAGRYVLRRINERRRMQRWDDLILDHNTGQLMQSSGRPRQGELPQYVPFERDTYFTLNVVREPGAFYYGGQTFAQLGEELEAAATARDQPFAQLETRILSSLAATRNRELVRELNDAWEAAAARYRLYASTYVDATIGGPTGQCPVPDSIARDRTRDGALVLARALSRQFLLNYQAAIDQQEGNAGVFTDEVQRSLLTMLADFFGPFAPDDPLNQSHLVDPATFRATFIGADLANAGKFHDAAVHAARMKWAARNCDALRAAGLAPPAPASAPAAAPAVPEPGADDADGQE